MRSTTNEPYSVHAPQSHSCTIVVTFFSPLMKFRIPNTRTVFQYRPYTLSNVGKFRNSLDM